MTPEADLGSAVMGTSVVSLREITDENREAVLALRIAASQEGYVSSVADSLEEARETPEGNPWYRAIYADDKPVGFVMISWNVTPDPPRIIGPWFLWKLLIDERHQGRGFGREAVKLVAGIAREQGAAELLTSYVSGERTPEPFYSQLGFVPTGEQDEKGEKVLALRLRT
jgi:diamine N-acetyltransferase